MGWTPPADAKTFPVRPLTRGMITELTSQQLPDGSFTDIQNMVVTQHGLMRFTGSTQFAGGAQFRFEPHSYFTCWRSDGAQTNLLLCDRATYLVDPNVGYEEIVWKYVSGSATVSGSTLTASSAAFTTNDIKKGDVIYVGTSSTNLTGYATIDNIVSDTQLVIMDSNIVDGSYTYSEVHRTLKPYVNPFADYVNIGDYTLVATGINGRPLAKIDPAGRTISYWMDTTGKMPGGVPCYPSIVAYFNDLVWVGDTYDSIDGRRVNRIRWSNYSDITDFSNPYNYVDLPYTSSRLMRLLPLGDMLIAYFADTIFVGRRTNYPAMPVQFFQIDTGGLGLLGIKAITSYLGAHVLITKVGACIFDGQNLTPIPCPVLSDFLKSNRNEGYNRVIYSELHNALLFCMANTDRYIDTIWVYDLMTKGWSYVRVDTRIVDSPIVSNIVTIDSATNAIDTYTNEIDSTTTNARRHTLYMDYNQQLWQTSATSAMFFNVIPIAVTLETQDYDFDTIDDIKTAYRLGLKIDSLYPQPNPISFTVTGSTNRGRTWKQLGQLVIRAGDDEGYINFRLTGSHVKFRLVSTANSAPYWITELSLQVRGSGSDESLNSQQPGS